MDLVLIRALLEQLENIVSDFDERELDCTDWEDLNRQELIQLFNSLNMTKRTLEARDNGWIPCTVTLPPQPKSNPEFEGKPLELYLVSMNDSKYPWRAFWNGKDFTDGFRVVYPVAWQPLPEGYKNNDLGE